MKNFKKFLNKVQKHYFIADIAANHDGDLIKAKELVHAASESGADAAKFQNFLAKTIVSDVGFKILGEQISHQSKWKKSVYETYRDAELPFEWSNELLDACKKYNIDFFSASYDLGITKKLKKFSEIFKIGSGEITWLEHLKLIENIYDYIIIATGASTIKDVETAYNILKKKNIVLMQCNTNYTANNFEDSKERYKRFASINLKVLDQYKKKFPKVILGLSDHTLSDTTVLASIGLYNVKVVEKHFTLNNDDEGPDHPFSITPMNWRRMVNRVNEYHNLIDNHSNFQSKFNELEKFVDDTKELELCLGDGIKKIEENEKLTSIIQRRGLYTNKTLHSGQILTRSDIDILRPCIKEGFCASELELIINKQIKKKLIKGDLLRKEDLIL